jgi:hypothetical protein
MNSEFTDQKPVWHIGVVFLVACFIFGGLVAIVRFSTKVPAIDADRAAVRTKDLQEIRSEARQELNNPGWVDKSRGVVRLPIEVAMKIAAKEWRDPASARADLISRAEKATAPLPQPKATSNPFE